jgi:hypothetical protein
MIIFDGQKLDLKNPKTETEKEVVLQFQEIIKDYGLDKGKRIHFVYPKKYEVPNRHDPMKIDRPRSFRIKYSSTLSTPTGTESWVYARNIGRDKKGAPRFTPPSRRFTGDLYLGIKDIDEIFYLLYKYPRTEGGKVSSKLPKFIAIHDVEVDAKTVVSENRSRVVIESKLYLDEDSGGLSGLQVMGLAKELRMPGSETKSEAVLRKELCSFLLNMQGGGDFLMGYIGKTSKGKSSKVDSSDDLGISKEPIQAPKLDVLKAEAKGVIEFYKVAGHLGWRWLKNGKPGGKIMSVTDEEKRYEDLVAFLNDDEESRRRFEEAM